MAFFFIILSYSLYLISYLTCVNLTLFFSKICPFGYVHSMIVVSMTLCINLSIANSYLLVIGTRDACMVELAIRSVCARLKTRMHVCTIPCIQHMHNHICYIHKRGL